MWDDTRSNFERNLAVVIGINDYQNGVHKLSTPVNDARVLADLLEAEYEYQEVIRLFPPHGEATLENLDKLLFDILPNKIKPTEADAVRLLFYFAGHGTARNSKQGLSGYLLPQDADPVKLESFLPMKKLYEALASLDCHHLLVILDCCFAGTFRWSSIRNVISIPETIHKEHYDRFIRYRAWQVISSAAYNQEALDVAPHYLTDPRGMVDNYGHSPFAMALIQGLSQQVEGEKTLVADLSKDGVITAPELYIHLRDFVEKSSNEFQTPGLWPLPQHDRGEFIFTKPNFNPNQLTPAPELDENNNPYRGLKPYDEEHARFFFGRQELIQQLSVWVSQPGQQLTTVLGISGSGKSSLVKAGLIPYLRKLTNSFPENLVYASILTLAIFQKFPLYPLKFLPINYVHQWQILEPMRPGESPFAALARTILAIANETFTAQLEQINFLNTALQEKAEQFAQLAPIWNDASLAQKLLLLIDRFEELKTAGSNSDEERQLEKFKNTFQDYLKNLIASLQTEPQEFINIITTWSQTHANVKVLLIIDQFEELITLSHNRKEDNNLEDKKEWQQFLKMLAQTLKSCPQLCLVLTLRSDFETRFIGSDLNAYWAKARFPVRQMRSDELRQAIVGPASEMALYFEPPNLVDRLIDETGQMPGALPLLSFTLSELYIKLYNKSKGQEKPQRILTIDENFERQGGVAGSITSRANSEYARMANDAERTTMRRVILRMLTIEGWDASRRQVPDSELVYRNSEENQRVTKVIEHLVQARLVVKGQETGEPYVEPAHDFLVRGWDKLQDWIKENRDDLMLQQRLIPAANDWDHNGRRSDLLWSDGDRLNQLEKILNQENNNWLNQREVEFVQASISYRDIQQRQAREQQTRTELLQKSDQVEYLLDAQPLNALVVAIQAVGENLEKIPQQILTSVESSLHRTISLARERNFLQPGAFSVAFSPDGEYIIGGGGDGTLQLWDKNGNPIGNPFKGHEASISSVAFSPNGEFVVSGSGDGLRLWNKEGNPIGNLFTGHQSGINSVAFSPNGEYIVSGGNDTTVRLWDTQGNLIASPFTGHQSGVKAVAFSPNGEYIVSGSDDGTSRLWDTKGNPIGNPFTGHESGIVSVALSFDGKHIVSGFRNGTLQLWDTAGNPIGEPFKGHDSKYPIQSVAFSSNGEQIVSGSFDRTVRLWDKQGNPIGNPFIGHNKFIYSVAFSSNGKHIISGGLDGIRIWDAQGNPIGNPFTGHESNVNAVAFSPSGEYIVSASDDATLRLWDTQGNPIGNPLTGHESNVKAVAFSPSGEYIISASDDTTLRLWDTQGNLIGNPFTGHESNVNTVAFSPSGEYIVSGGEDRTLRLWDTHGNPIGNPFTGHQSRVTSVAFSSNGEYIASGSSDGSLRLWDLKGNPIIDPIALDDVWVDCVAFSPDSKQIVSGINNDLLSGRGLEGILRLWDIEGHPMGNPFTGHNDSVTSVAFSPDGTLIVSGGADSTVRLWDRQGNSIGNPFTGHQSRVTCVAFSPNGEQIVSGSFDGTVRLWQVNWVLWLQIACDRLRHHPIFKNPETEVAKQACETCENYIWNPSSGAQKLYEQAMQRMKDEENFQAAEDKNFSAALTILNLAIRFNSAHAGAYYLRGRCYAKLNNQPEATEDFQKAAGLYQQLGQTSSEEYQEVINFLNQLQSL